MSAERRGRRVRGGAPRPESPREPIPAPAEDDAAYADEPVADVRPRRSKAAAALAGRRSGSGALKRTLPQDQEQAEAPAAPGWRSSRRTSKGGKQARRAAKVERVREEVSEATTAATNAAVRFLQVAGASAVSIIVVIALLWGVALGINAFARWNARRVALADAAKTQRELGKENLLVIGVKDKVAVGFIALKAERAGARVLGIAIPDGAFVEVPGQGFESIGDSFHGGPEVSKDTVSNFLMVPFQRYVTVDASVYQSLLTEQDTKGLLDRAIATDLTASEKKDLAAFLSTVKSKDVWIVPMPVKPISVGSEKYFEPQRAEISDLVLQWWRVRLDQQKQALRVMIYNGVGTPGIAGKAARQLIRLGVRVVDSKNADRFDYKTTRILLYHGTQADAEHVKDALGVGDISVVADVQDLADVIVIIGADYVPPDAP